jgi:hypothetical protein
MVFSPNATCFRATTATFYVVKEIINFVKCLAVLPRFIKIRDIFDEHGGILLKDLLFRELTQDAMTNSGSVSGPPIQGKTDATNKLLTLGDRQLGHSKGYMELMLCVHLARPSRAMNDAVYQGLGIYLQCFRYVIANASADRADVSLDVLQGPSRNVDISLMRTFLEVLLREPVGCAKLTNPRSVKPVHLTRERHSALSRPIRVN